MSQHPSERRLRPPRTGDDVAAGRSEALDVLLKELDLPASWRSELGKLRSSRPHLSDKVTADAVETASEVFGRLLERADARERQLQSVIGEVNDDLSRAVILLRLVLRVIGPGLYRDHAVTVAARRFVDEQGQTTLESDVEAALRSILAGPANGGASVLAEAVRAAAERAVVTYEHDTPEGLPLRDADLDDPTREQRASR